MNVLNANEVYTLKLLNDELHAMWIFPQYKQKNAGQKKSRKEDKSAIQGSLECSSLPLTLLTKTLSPVHWCSRPDAPLQHNDLLGLGQGLCKIDSSTLGLGQDAWLLALAWPVPPWGANPGPVYLTGYGKARVDWCMGRYSAPDREPHRCKGLLGIFMTICRIAHKAISSPLYFPDMAANFHFCDLGLLDAVSQSVPSSPGLAKDLVILLMSKQWLKGMQFRGLVKSQSSESIPQTQDRALNL